MSCRVFKRHLQEFWKRRFSTREARRIWRVLIINRKIAIRKDRSRNSDSVKAYAMIMDKL